MTIMPDRYYTDSSLWRSVEEIDASGLRHDLAAYKDY
jgi:hypothetical protein